MTFDWWQILLIEAEMFKCPKILFQAKLPDFWHWTNYSSKYVSASFYPLSEPFNTRLHVCAFLIHLLPNQLLRKHWPPVVILSHSNTGCNSASIVLSCGDKINWYQALILMYSYCVAQCLTDLVSFLHCLHCFLTQTFSQKQKITGAVIYTVILIILVKLIFTYIQT